MSLDNMRNFKLKFPELIKSHQERHIRRSKKGTIYYAGRGFRKPEELEKIKKLEELYKEYRGLVRAKLGGIRKISFELKKSKKWGASIRKSGPIGLYEITFRLPTFENETLLRQVMIHELMHVRFWKKGRKVHHTASWRRLEKKLFKKAGLPENFEGLIPGTIEENVQHLDRQTRSYSYGSQFTLGYKDLKKSDIALLRSIFNKYYWSMYKGKKFLPYKTILRFTDTEKVPEIKKENNVVAIELSPIKNVDMMTNLLIEKKGKYFLEHYFEHSSLGKRALLNAYQMFHEIGHLTDNINIYATEEEADSFARDVFDQVFRKTGKFDPGPLMQKM